MRPKVDQRAGLLSLPHLGNFRRNARSPHLPLVNIQLNIVTSPMYPDKITRDNVVAPFVRLCHTAFSEYVWHVTTGWPKKVSHYQMIKTRIKACQGD